MATHIHTSIPDEQAEFIDEEGLSPAKLLQDKISEKMQESGNEVPA